MSASRRLLLLLFALSGAAGLGVELALSRLLADAIGGAALATAAAAAAYLGGLGLGALAGGRAGARSRRGILVRYALLELAGAAAALALPELLPWLRLSIGVLGGHAAGRLAVAVFALLPVAFLGGATLPLCAAEVGAPGAGRLYAANALGGAGGVAVTGLWLMPEVGLRGSCAMGAALQLAVALAALALAREGAAPAPRNEALRPSPSGGARTLLAAGLCGASGLAAEILWTRILLPWLGGTSTAMAGLLGLYLLGLGLGACAAPLLRLETRRLWLLPAAAGLCQAALGAFAVGRLGQLIEAQPLAGMARPWPIAALWILPTTACFGAATPLFFLRRAEGRPAARAVSEVAAASGFGSAVGALAAPLVLAPLVGARLGLLVAAALALAAAVPLLDRRSLLPWAAFTSLAAACGLWLNVLEPRRPPQLRIVARAEGTMAEAWAVEEPIEGARGLIVNGRLREGGTALEARIAERLQGHVPLLWHAAPRTALFLGVGTGLSLGAAAMHPGVAATGVELLPEVLQLLPAFAPFNETLSRTRVVEDDARAYLPSHAERFDVIVAELFYPWEVGAGGLYSVDQYREVRAHLEPGGLFCQWLPLYLLPPPALSVVAASLRAVFPHTAALAGLIVERQPQVALCGSEAPFALPSDVDVRVARLSDGGELGRLWGQPSEALRSLFLFGDEGVRALAGAAPVETDLRPRVEFLCAGETERLGAREVGRHRDPDWVLNLRRIVELTTPAGPAGQARLALWREAIARGDGDGPRALELQSEAVALAPWLAESALPGLRLEGMLRRAQRYDEAEALLARAAQTLEPDASTLFLLGTLRLRTGDTAAALGYLRRATQADARCARCQLFLGLALQRAGDRADAAVAWRRALALEPDDGRARRYLAAANLLP